jgi:hypothetical protein
MATEDRGEEKEEEEQAAGGRSSDRTPEDVSKRTENFAETSQV